MRGDCSIQIDSQPFSPKEIHDCAIQQGLLCIEIELAAAQNCNCNHCTTHQANPTLNLQQIIDAIDQAHKLGARRVILVDSNTGPYPHLAELIQQIKSRNLAIELFPVDSTVTPDFAGLLFQKHVDISFSLRGNDPPAMFEALKNAGYTTTDSPRLAARIFFNSQTVQFVPTAWRWARNHRVVPHLQTYSPLMDAPQSPSIPTPDQLRLLYHTLAQIDHEEFDRAWTTDPALTGRSCNRHQYATHLTACGNLFPCVGVTIPLGNITTEPLADILKLSDVLEDLRAYKEKVKEPCHTCTQTVPCYGCRGSAYQLTGDYLAGDQLCWKAEKTPIEVLPINVSHIIPHGPSIRMVDQLVQIGERKSTTHFTVPPDSAWIDSSGKLDESAYIEIIAQSFAASHGFKLTPQQRAAHRGLLLGVKDLRITGEAHAGDQLIIHIRKLTRFGDFGIVEGDVHHDDGRLIATGQVKVWRPGEEAAKGMME